MAFSKSISIGVLVFVLALVTVSCANGRRGNGEHQLRQLRPTRGFKEMELAAARNFGKRAVDMHVVNSIFWELMLLENKIKELNMQRRRNNLLPLETVQGMSELTDDNLSSNSVSLDE